jgi:hypothetical protein
MGNGVEQLTDSLDLVEERASSNAIHCAGEFGGNIAADSEGSLFIPKPRRQARPKACSDSEEALE